MGEKSEQLKKSMADKAKAEAAQKKFQTLQNQVYLPDSEVVIKGDAFLALLQFVNEARGSRVSYVVDQVNNVIGQTIHPKDGDIERIYQLVAQLHEVNYDAGITVDRAVAIEAFQAAQKKAQVGEGVVAPSENGQVSETEDVPQTPSPEVEQDVVKTKQEPEDNVEAEQEIAETEEVDESKTVSASE